MWPANRLRVLALVAAWGAVVLNLSAGTAWAQTTEPPVASPPPAAAEPAPPARAAGNGGKGFSSSARLVTGGRPRR